MSMQENAETRAALLRQMEALEAQINALAQYWGVDGDIALSQPTTYSGISVNFDECEVSVNYNHIGMYSDWRPRLTPSERRQMLAALHKDSLV